MNPGSDQATTDHTSSARDTLVVEIAGQSDLPTIHKRVQNTRIEVARFAPHALIAHVGNLTERRSSGRDYDMSIHQNVLSDLQMKAVARLQLLALGSQFFAEFERHLGSNAQHRPSRWCQNGYRGLRKRLRVCSARDDEKGRARGRN